MTTDQAPVSGLLPAIKQVAHAAMLAAFGDAVMDADPLVRHSEFADFQLDAALPLARLLRQNPRQIAEIIVAHLDPSGPIKHAAVSGPGYINITLNEAWLAQLITLPIVKTGKPQTVVIDYSAPNVAKEMHVGHIRTTIVGDALARLNAAAGHHVIRQNHIGDWGTPFGMLIEYGLDAEAAGQDLADLMQDANAFYQAARRRYDTEPAFAERARQRVVLLQAHDTATIARWQQLVTRSIDYFTATYDLLNVSLTPADIRGESAYDTQLAAICDELEQAGLATISDGALCVFLPGFTNREGQPLPLMLRKRDGGYTYATTDLAAAKYRLQTLAADKVLYVVGEAQATHFQMVFATVETAGWNTRGAELTHVKIGNMLGDDGKLLRTRSGDSVKLADLVQDAIKTADAVLATGEIVADERATIARQVGIGALKYADLALDHATSYVFDLQRMVALTGNTGPYLQYTAVRIQSILRQVDAVAQPGSITLTAPAEKQLALALAGYPEALDSALTELAPHLLCAHLFNLAQQFSRFYTQHQVLQEVDPSLRASRLYLCELALAQLIAGLGLLGIEVPARM